MGFICTGRRELEAASAMGVRVGSNAAAASSAAYPGGPSGAARPSAPRKEPRAWAPRPGPASPPLRRSPSPPAIDAAAPVATRLRSFTSAQELLAVQRTLAALGESGFYWGSVAGPEARRLLAAHPAGTFLVRDSTDSRHLFSLTLRTRASTTSVRVQLHAGRFRLECSARRDALPGFDCVLKLLEHYVRPPRGGGGGGDPGAGNPPAPGRGGETETRASAAADTGPASGGERRQRDEEEEAAEEEEAEAGLREKGRTPLLLTRPLRHTRLAPLQHLARKAVHRALGGRHAGMLQLPALLQGYVETYPYQL